MLNYRLLQQLAPLNFRYEDRTESLPDYLQRVSPLLPGVPPNLLAQWIYRHWRGFESNWSFLDLSRMQVHPQWLSTSQLCEQVDTRHRDVVERWSDMLRSNRYVRRSWLAEYMMTHGTWPEPIIVLAPQEGETYPDGTLMPRPWALLEGHHRLAYLKCLAEDNHPLQNRHPVWVLQHVSQCKTFLMQEMAS